MGNDYSVTKGEAAQLFERYVTGRYVSKSSDKNIHSRYTTIKLIIERVFSAYGIDGSSDKLSNELAEEMIPIATPIQKGGKIVDYIVNPLNSSKKIACSSSSNLTKMINICMKNISHDIANSETNRSSRFLEGFVQLELPNGARNASLYWEALPEPIVLQAAIKQEPRRKIIVLGRILKTSFSTDLMRGVRAMARELGADLVDWRTWSDNNEKYYEQIKYQINIIAEFKNKKQIGILLYFIELNGDIIPSIEGLTGFTKLHAGYDRENSISIKYSDSARQIVQHLISMRGSKGKWLPSTVLLPEFDKDDLGESHPLVIRQGTYRYEIEVHNAKKIKEKNTDEKIELVPIKLKKYDLDRDTTDKSGIKEIERKIKQYGESVYAIFGRSHQLTLDVIKLVKGRKAILGKTLSPIHVFGENLTTDLLVRLNDASDPLEAVCSADPYFINGPAKG